ncbi:MAG: hypothetical protein WC382_13510 [Methanoregulaceae archaeon]|jgi:hypothetical protein
MPDTFPEIVSESPLMRTDWERGDGMGRRVPPDTVIGTIKDSRISVTTPVTKERLLFLPIILSLQCISDVFMVT